MNRILAQTYVSEATYVKRLPLNLVELSFVHIPDSNLKNFL